MGGLFGKSSNATTPQQLNSISVDRSRYGDPVPLVYGMQRVPLTLLWYGAFTANAVTSSGSGKGGGSQITGYNYTASCVMGLCEGPAIAIHTVWKDKAITTIANEDLSGPFLGAGGQAIWSYLSENFPSQAVPYDHTCYVGAITLNLGGSAALPNYTFEVQGFLSAASSTAISFTSAPGSGAVSAQVLGTSPIADGLWDITFSDFESRTCTQVTTGSVSTISWDSTNPLINAVSATALVGGWDAEPSAVVIDYCTDVNHGAGFNFLDQDQITSHTWTSGGVTYDDSYKVYCTANGLFISPWEDTQRAASDALKDIMQITNSNVVVSAGLMKIVPYGDNVVSGNGVTYTPNLQPLFAFTDDDYVQAGANNVDDPVVLIRKPLTETYNVVRVEFYDRGNAYNAALSEWSDPLDIADNGIRVMGTVTLHQITQASIASKVAALIGQRQLNVRNQWSFSVRNDAYTLLEPMDLIAVTDSGMGLVDRLCRITKVEDDKDDTFTITCEDMLIGTASAPLYNIQAAQGYKANYAVIPPSVVAVPVIFTAPPTLVGQGGGFELWIAVGPAAPTGSQTSDYGGCNVSASLDDVTWTSIGSVVGSCRFGNVTTGHGIGVDDTTIYLTMNAETYELGYFLESASASDFAANRALLYVDGEIMGFETVTLLSTANYEVTVSRGLFQTPQTSHGDGAGTLWARLDQSILKMAIDPGMIGQTIYFEFSTFNSTGHELQSPTTFSQLIENSGGLIGGLNLVNGAGVTIIGNEAFKSASTTAWDSSCYSAQNYTNGCSAGCYPAQNNLDLFLGLSTNPTASNSYTNLNYGWHMQSNGELMIFESGTNVGSFGSYTPGDFFQVTHDGKHVCYYHNGTLIRTVANGNGTFFLQMAFYNPNATAFGIEFSTSAQASQPYTLEVCSAGSAANDVQAAGTRASSLPGSTSAWGQKGFQSVAPIANGFSLSFQPSQTGGALIVGVSTSPTITASDGTGAGFTAGWYLHGDSTQIGTVFDGGNFTLIASRAPALTDVYTIVYDNFYFYWKLNGALVNQTPFQNAGPLYLFGDFYEGSLGIYNIAFESFGNATPVQFIARGNASVADSFASKIGGSSAWDSDIYSIAGYATANVVFKANATTGHILGGLTTLIPQSPSYATIYGFDINAGGTDGAWSAFSVGSEVSGVTGTYDTTTRFAVTYDGSTVTWLVNNQSVYTLALSAATMFADIVFYNPGATINSLDFGPGSTVPLIDTTALGNNAATATIVQTSAGPIALESDTFLGLNSITVGPYPFATTIVGTATGEWQITTGINAETGGVSVYGAGIGASVGSTSNAFWNPKISQPASTTVSGAFTIESTFALAANATETIYTWMGNGSFAESTTSGTVSNITTKLEVIKR